MLRNGASLSYDIPDDIKVKQEQEIRNIDSVSGSNLISFLHENEVGKDTSFKGPFGGRKIGEDIKILAASYPLILVLRKL